MHPEFFQIMDETQAWLRYGFQTSNNATLAVSGTGHAAMESAVANTVEPNDRVIVGVNGEANSQSGACTMALSCTLVWH
jgi:alanine-glyoxylate transaminase/serine-glyoxylate transaminase/serine-pyruvate transaminase